MNIYGEFQCWGLKRMTTWPWNVDFVFLSTFSRSQIPFFAIDLCSTRCSAGRVPEAGFRRHAPRQREGSCWYGWRAGWMCSVVSLMGIYISLSGRRSISAITQPCCTAIASRATCEGMQPHIVSDPALDFSLPHRSCF